MASKGVSKIESYKGLFQAYDKDGSGTLSIGEFRNMLLASGCKLSDSQIADFFVFFDGARGDKEITYNEFEKGLSQIMAFVDQVTKLFKELDADGSGYLDRTELKALLDRTGKKFTEDEVTAILKEADKNGDNKINMEEFIDAVC